MKKIYPVIEAAEKVLNRPLTGAERVQLYELMMRFKLTPDEDPTPVEVPTQ